MKKKSFRFPTGNGFIIILWEPLHSGPTEVEDCSLPPPNMAATKTGEQGNAWFSVL